MAKTKTKTKNRPSASSLLSNIGSKKTTKSKSTTPVIRITDEEQSSQITAIAKSKKWEKEAKSAVTLACGEFADTAKMLFEKRCHNDATLYTSVKMVTSEDSVTYTQSRRCKKMTEEEDSDTLHRIFEDKFDENFEVVKPIAIACEKLSNDQIVDLIEAMQNALPPDVFEDVVDYTPQIVAKEGFFSRRILDAETAKLARQAESEGVAIPFSASFKL